MDNDINRIKVVLTEDRANNMFKSIFFNELYDQRVRKM